MIRSLARLSLVLILAATALRAAAAGEQVLPIFDAHLHYNAEAQAPWPLPRVLDLFRANGVTAVLATSRPNDGTRALVASSAADPSASPRVVPFVRPYRVQADRATWFADPAIEALVESELARPIDYRGIGEFHVFGKDAASPGMGRIVALAVARGLWLHAHCDEEALAAIYAHDSRVRVIWAHTGFTTPPERIAQWLAKHPTLVGELSYRDDLTEDGRLKPGWRTLLVAHADRFLLGSDTWVNERWDRYGDTMAYYRDVLGQLPPEAARAIAHGNGERLFPPSRARP